jgi:hypothetical protein
LDGKKWYESVEEMQTDLDVYLNDERGAKYFYLLKECVEVASLMLIDHGIFFSLFLPSPIHLAE